MISLGPTWQPLITAVATAANSNSRPIDVHGADEITIYLQSNGTTSGGTVVIEEASYDPDGPVYSGTWSQIGATINASAFTGTAQQAIHLPTAAYHFIRVRIATDITGGGTASAFLKMQ